MKNSKTKYIVCQVINSKGKLIKNKGAIVGDNGWLLWNVMARKKWNNCYTM